MIERFFVGPDALIGPLDGSFRRGVSPPAGGEFLSQRWERNQWPRPPSLAPSGQFTLRIAGDAADGLRLRFAPPRSIGPFSPDPKYGGYPLRWAEHFRRAKSEWQSIFTPGHWALSLQKLGPGTVPQLRLSLPNQRARSVFAVGAAHLGRPGTARWGHRALQKIKRTFGYAVGAGALTRPPVP